MNLKEKIKLGIVDLRSFNGGHRPGAGRKPKVDKLVQVRFSVLQSNIDKLGGVKDVSEFAKKLVINHLYGTDNT